ncbi:O-antigen ligase family protein [Gracilibacillus sp. JCM 18860]|uniref:O-antigen ligase family protein n=1 Tax=Gracilibacillus sp. JCM 18860 TaxID=1306159 RepID=UPI000A6184AB
MLTSIFLCFQTGSTITLIALLIGLVINIFIFFVRTLVNKGRSKYLLISIMSGISLIIFSIILSTNRIGNYLIDISGNFNKLYQSRLILLGNMLTGEGSGGTLTARINLYMQSISTFLDNFWIGTIEISGLMTNYLIGGHSELFDSFAKLGIIGASIYISIFVINLFMYRPIKNIFMYTGYIITFFILLTFNPFHYPQSNFVYFFICSSLFHISKNRVHSNQINDNNLKEFQRKNS